MRKASGLLLAIVFVIALLSPVDAVGAESEQLQQMWVVSTRLSLTNIADSGMKNARIQMPLLAESTLYGEVIDQTFSVEATEITADDEGNRQGIFTLQNLQPGQTAVVTLTHVIQPGPADDSLVTYPTDESEFLEAPEEIADRAERLTAGLDDSDKQFNALLRFVRSHMRYSSESEWRNGDALQALHRGEGVCEDYASLLVAMSNSLGIHSRMVYGYRRSPGADSWVRHAWVEYLAGDGQWVSVDPTFHSSPGLNDDADYLAQWHSDSSIRIRHTGGILRAQLAEEIQEIEVPKDQASGDAGE